MLPSSSAIVRYDAKNATEDLSLKWNLSVSSNFDAENTYIMCRTGDPDIIPKLVADRVFEAIRIKLGLGGWKCPR